GQIGYALIFRVAAGALLGPDGRVNLHLLEITPALPALQGVVMELNDCAFPTLNRVVASDDARVAFRDCQIALLVGARPRGPGMGNHSSSQYPDLRHAEVAGKPAKSLVSQQWIEETFIPVVQQRGAAVIKARGASSAASAACAVIDHMRSWLNGTREGDWV